jgi:hypothetical protein
MLVFVLGPRPVRAEVVDASPGGFTVRSTATVGASPSEAYRHLVSSLSRWWNPAHTFSKSSRNLTLDARADGCLCERLVDGGSVRHLEVVFAEPGKWLRLTGGLGPLQSFAVNGVLTWGLSAAGDSTTIEATYVVGGYRSGGLEKLAAPVDGVIGDQLARLARFIDTGQPEPPAK